MFGKRCRYALLHATQESRAINCTVSPFKSSACFVSQAAVSLCNAEHLCLFVGQSESDSPIEPMVAEWDTSTKWCCHQDVEVVPGAAFTQNVRSVWFVVKRRGCCCNLSGGVAWNVWFTMNKMCVKKNTIHMWREQAILEWSRRLISIVAFCHSAKLCADAARDFRSEQYLPTFTSEISLASAAH